MGADLLVVLACRAVDVSTLLPVRTAPALLSEEVDWGRAALP